MSATTVLEIRTKEETLARCLAIDGPSVRIGRGDQCEVRLGEPRLADVQCLLRRRGDTWHLQPVGPPGWISIDGRSVEVQRPIPFGMSVRIGEHWLTLAHSNEPVVESVAVGDRPTAPERPGPEVPRSDEADRPTDRPTLDLERERLTRWETRLRQRERWINDRRDEKLWEARWRSAADRLRDRPGGAPEVSTPRPSPDLRDSARSGLTSGPSRRAAMARTVPGNRSQDQGLSSDATGPDSARPHRTLAEPVAPGWSHPPAEKTRELLPDFERIAEVLDAFPTAVDPPESVPIGVVISTAINPSSDPMVDASRPAPPVVPLKEDDRSIRISFLDPNATERLRDFVRASKREQDPGAPAGPTRAATTAAESAPERSGIVEPEGFRCSDTVPKGTDEVRVAGVAVGRNPSPGREALGFADEPQPPHRHLSSGNSFSAEPEFEAALDDPVGSVRSPSTSSEPARADTESPPADDGFGIGPATSPRHEWPSVRVILASQAGSEAATGAREVRRPPIRAVRLTTPRAPAQWQVPRLAWTWPPAALALTTVASLALATVALQAVEEGHAGVLANRLAMGRERGAIEDSEALDPLPLGFRPSWWNSTVQGAYLKAWALDRPDAQPERAEQVDRWLRAARHASPAHTPTRYVGSRKAAGDVGTSDLHPADWPVALGGDAVPLAWTAHRLHETGHTEVALRVYRRALDRAARDADPREAPPFDDAEKGSRRYRMPAEPLLRLVLDDLMTRAGGPPDRWVAALPDEPTAWVVALRLLKEKNPLDFDRLLATFREKSAVATDSPRAEARRLAARGEALALDDDHAGGAVEYGLAIECAPEGPWRRALAHNLADLHRRLGDEASARLALDEARGSGRFDEISRRAARVNAEIARGSRAAEAHSPGARPRP